MFLLKLRGNISIDINQSPFLLLTFKDDIRIDIQDTSILDLINDDKEEKFNFFKLFGNIREFAKSLKHQDKTIIISVKGKDVVILGKNAHPSLSKIVSKSDDIEIKSIFGLAKISFEILD